MIEAAAILDGKSFKVTKRAPQVILAPRDPAETFLAAEFSGAARHLRRLSKVASLEA